MSFLAPIFLLGTLAVGLPVIFHLIRRTTRERTPFSSLMFLFSTPPRLTKRSRLEHWALLALRCLALFLLAAGFARPFVKRTISPAPPTEARRVLLLVDSSASMRRADLWPDAREQVRRIVRGTTPGDQVALFTFDRETRALMSFDEWNSTPPGDRAARLESRLAAASPGWSSTRLDSALIQAAEAVSDNAGKSKAQSSEIILIGDFQEGSHLEQLQGYEWPRNIKVTAEPLKAKHSGNASLQLVAGSDTGLKPEDVRVRVSNTADSRIELFKIGWTAATTTDFVGTPVTAYVPPGQSRVLNLPRPNEALKLNRVLLKGDEEEFDNVVFTVPPERNPPKVLYLGSESASDARQPLYFLQRALHQPGQQEVEVFVHSPANPLSDSEVQGVSLVVVADALPREGVEVLHAQLLKGRTCLCLFKNDTLAQTLSGLLGTRQVSVEEARLNKYAMLAEIDFRDPLFAPFADPRFSDFTKIHFWKYRRLTFDPDVKAQVLAKFDSGDPALVETPVGAGRILVLASGWQPEDSQFALSTKFVPWLYSLLEKSGAPIASPAMYHVGDVVTLPVNALADGRGWKVMTPGWAEVSLMASQTNFLETTTPGVYTAVWGGTSNQFAVNLDAAESRTPAFSPEELEKLGVPLSNPALRPELVLQKEIRVQNSELESRQKLWRWLILAAIAILLLETWLAGRAARQASKPVAPELATEGATL